jgi:nucleotide-binding universal stress UspA family protein
MRAPPVPILSGLRGGCTRRSHPRHVRSRRATGHASPTPFHVAASPATLIVTGGYGQARLREIVLGGVTRDMLKSMTVAVFMSP